MLNSSYRRQEATENAVVAGPGSTRRLDGLNIMISQHRTERMLAIMPFAIKAKLALVLRFGDLPEQPTVLHSMSLGKAAIHWGRACSNIR